MSQEPLSRRAWAILVALCVVAPVSARADVTLPPPTPLARIPPTAPRYELDIRLEIENHQALVRQRVTWTNPCTRPATELIFNAHSRYQLPESEIGFMAKTVELLRMVPSEVLDTDGRACEIEKVNLLPFHRSYEKADKPPEAPEPAGPELAFHFQAENATALVVPLPTALAQGETVTIEIAFRLRLPQKQGRWGQWRGVTFLSNWQPVAAFYDESGWHPTPFVAWHQPFFNEAGAFRVQVVLPADQKIACTGSIVASADLGNGLRRVEIDVSCARDFALLCSAHYQEHLAQAGPVRVRCLALPEHEHYGQAAARFAAEAIEAYSRWFGPYPYPEFTIVESYFGWNGNECAGLVMIDERVFGLPHVADGFFEYLISHETCHQWWYNVVGTNGYAETWMDEGLAVYFSHRLLNQKHGKNSMLLTMPGGLEWLPNISRETYRTYGYYGTLGRGEAGPTVQDMPKFGHVVSLFSMCYDRGSRIVGMIEDRLGEAAFLDFMHRVYSRYYFRILRVADFERELESYTGRSWQDFFQHWLYSADCTDWCIEKVKINDLPADPPVKKRKLFCSRAPSPCTATVYLRQKAEYNEQTVLGFSLDGSDNYQIRVPILPQVPHLQTDNPPATIEMLPGNRVRVEVALPCRPTQIAVDPDQVLVDKDPSNNFWKRPIRWRFSGLYVSALEENDLTTAYDRWNVTWGPWLYASSYDDPWFTRSDMAGVRLGIYRTQEFSGGVYAAYRSDYRDLAVGVDGLLDHWPWCSTQIGVIAERSLTNPDGALGSDRGVLFGRYVFQYASSLYLPPMNYLEAFAGFQDNNLPFAREAVAGAERFDHTLYMGLHYHLDYLTPYWYPEGGFRLDASYAGGVSDSGNQLGFNQVSAQFSTVKNIPDGLGWFSDTSLACRIYGAAAGPSHGEFFSMGGSSLFRGFDLNERQGSLVWVGSAEWRFPIVRGITWDCVDHSIGLRNIYGAAFYDVGEAYVGGHNVGNIAHAVGGGLRLDVAWFSFVERSTIRLDVAQTVNVDTPLQFWLGFQLPF